MRALLTDSELQATLDRDGYVTIPVLGKEKLDALNAFYNEIHPDGKAPGKIENIHMTTWCEDYHYKTKVGAFIKESFKVAIDNYFFDYRTLNEVFIVKERGEATTFKVHQDWSIVDEKTTPSVNVWMPLHDVDESSGALWTLPGSHKIDRPVRGSGYLFPDYSPFFDKLEENAVSVGLKAGHAIVFYLNAIHGSPPNVSRDERRATCFTVIPKDAELNIYFQPEKEMPLECHNPPDDFMYRYKHLRTDTVKFGPTDSPAEVKDSYVNEPVTFEEIRPMLALENEPNGIWKKLTGIFKSS